jgi:hypothetical protein
MESGLTPTSRETRMFVAGHRGLVGSALWRHFTDQGFANLIGAGSAQLDVRDHALPRRSSIRHAQRL